MLHVCLIIHKMSFVKAYFTQDNSFKLCVGESELKRHVFNYINHMYIPDWSYHFNRIFISPGISFNAKYFIKYMSSKLTKRKQLSKPCDPLITLNVNRTISHQERRLGVPVEIDNDQIDNDEEHIIDNILDRLTGEEFIRLLDIEPEKRIETIMHQYRVYNKVLDGVPFDKLDKMNNNMQTNTVPYEIYTEADEHLSMDIKNEYGDFVKTVNSFDRLGLLKTCGVIVIDVSNDITALSKGKEIFWSFKKELIKCKSKDENFILKNKRLVIVISTVMTWSGDGKRRVLLREKNVDKRVPNPEFMELYEFEREVLALNQTEGLKEMVTTVIVWTGVTYGFEQDLLKFAFDSACKNSDLFPIPKSENVVPVMHVENLARLLHEILYENHKLKYHCIFATESPMYTLRQIIIALGKTCNVEISNFVSLETFMETYKLEGIQKYLLSADIKVNSSIKRLWPNFEWYTGKSTIIFQMKSLVEAYKIEHNIKSGLKFLVLGPPASGKTKLAQQLAKHYGSIYLEPKEVVRNHIDRIREEIVSLKIQQFDQYAETLEDIDLNDRTEVIKQNDSPITQKLSELNEKLDQLFTSMDSNDGQLEDIHLIPLMNETMSNLFDSKREYVLDGFPSTEAQARLIFNVQNSPRLIDVNKLPELTVCLTQKEQFTSNPLIIHSDYEDINNIEITQNNTKSKKKRLSFSNNISVFPSNTEITFKPDLSMKAAKPILKNESSTKKREENPKRVVWDRQLHNNLLKMLSSYYVPIKTIDSPYSPLGFDVNFVELPEIDVIFQKLLNSIVKQIDLDQRHGLLNHTGNINSEELKIELKKIELEKLKYKMNLLEDFEKMMDFEHIQNLSSDEYLIKYVTTTLTKLTAQIAKLRPKNPVDFFACMALRENPEGSSEFPYYSKNTVKIQRLLEQMFQIRGYDDNNHETEQFIESLSVHPVDDTYEEIGEESVTNYGNG